LAVVLLLLTWIRLRWFGPRRRSLSSGKIAALMPGSLARR